MIIKKVMFLLFVLCAGGSSAQNTGIYSNAPDLSNTNCSGKDIGTVFHGMQTIFVKNQGQVNEDILYYSWFPQGISIYKDHINIYGTDVVIKKNKQPSFNSHSMVIHCNTSNRMTMINSEVNDTCYIEGASLQQGVFSYFGPNTSVSNIPSYGEVVFTNIYPNIDLTLTGMQQGKVEFIWNIHPGGSVNDICLEIKRAKVKKTSEGEILVTPKKKNALPFTIGSIYAYQPAEEIREYGIGEIKETPYTLCPISHTSVRVQHFIKKNRIKYIAAAYDKTLPLIIDPVAATILASANVDYATALIIDGVGGNVFVAGRAGNTTNFTVTAQSTYFGGAAGGQGVFVTKLSNDLNTHIATAVLRASAGTSYCNAIALDGAGGNVFVSGRSGNAVFAANTYTFGTTGGIEAFVAKLNNALTDNTATALLASTGTDDALYGIALDGTNVFVSGVCNGTNFATNRTTFGTAAGTSDGFVAKLGNALTTNPATAILTTGTSTSTDYAYDLAVDGAGGDVIVGGYTSVSATFGAPVSSYTFGTTGGTYDAIVSKLNNALTSHLVKTVVTSSLLDQFYRIALDGVGGNVFAVGQTTENENFGPSTNKTIFGAGALVDGAPVVKLNNALSTHLATAILTSTGGELAYGLTIDGAGGNVFVGGYTTNYVDFVLSPPPYYGTLGLWDAFITKLDNGLATHIATDILTGGADDYIYDIAIDGIGGSLRIAGLTANSANFVDSRTTFGTAGSVDAFVTKLGNDLNPLPVELLYFSGEGAEQNRIRLYWLTASETNNDYFTIEKGTRDEGQGASGIQFTSIGTVKGAGNSSTIKNYEFTDTELPLPTAAAALYYRLKQTDYDGRYEYFGPISVKCKPGDDWDLLLQNTSATDELLGTLFLPEDANVQVDIFDLQGRKINTKQWEVGKGSNFLNFDVKNIASGIYFLKVYNKGKQITKKFIKI